MNNPNDIVKILGDLNVQIDESDVCDSITSIDQNAPEDDVGNINNVDITDIAQFMDLDDNSLFVTVDKIVSPNDKAFTKFTQDLLDDQIEHITNLRKIDPAGELDMLNALKEYSDIYHVPAKLRKQTDRKYRPTTFDYTISKDIKGVFKHGYRRMFNMEYMCNCILQKYAITSSPPFYIRASDNALTLFHRLPECVRVSKLSSTNVALTNCLKRGDSVDFDVFVNPNFSPDVEDVAEAVSTQLKKEIKLRSNLARVCSDIIKSHNNPDISIPDPNMSLKYATYYFKLLGSAIVFNNNELITTSLHRIGIVYPDVIKLKPALTYCMSVVMDNMLYDTPNQYFKMLETIFDTCITMFLNVEYRPDLVGESELDSELTDNVINVS